MQEGDEQHFKQTNVDYLAQDLFLNKGRGVCVSGRVWEGGKIPLSVLQIVCYKNIY